MKQKRSDFRHELKFLVDERDLALIEAAIAPLTKPDPYHPEGAYRIRSVYFDDPWDSALRQNLDGTSPRSKYRIRIYGNDVHSLHLEKKSKDHDLTCKRSCAISQEEYERLMDRQGAGRLLAEAGPRAQEGEDPAAGNAGYRAMQRHALAPAVDPARGNAERRPPEGGDRSLLFEFEAMSAAKFLRPVVLVEYERTAFTCREGNVRITFDRNLSSSPYVFRMEDERLPKRPVLPAGQQLLEIKYDEFLPGYLRKALHTGKQERTTFSKYALCRMCGTAAMPAARGIR